MTHRLNSSAALTLIMAIESMYDDEIPGDFLDGPAMRALGEMAALIVCVDNDVISCPLENQAMKSRQSLINSIAHHEAIPLDEALGRTIDIRERRQPLSHPIQRRPHTVAGVLEGMNHADLLDHRAR
ncbi:terpene synthase family protein [Streptomyces sp. NPDC001941]|uniref:terpene synthase family protein n=1 Tax=Streptomyces sp. NPDC001941 TaxID=3154659 RepID=UPI003321B92E